MSERQEAERAIDAALIALRALDQHRNLHAAVPILLLPVAALVSVAAFFRLVDLFLFLGAARIDEVAPAMFAFLFSLAAFILAYVAILVVLDGLGFSDLRGQALRVLASYEFSRQDLEVLQERVRSATWNHRDLFDRVLADLSQS